MERIRAVLRESAWPGLEASADASRKRKRAKRYTRAQLESIVQASPDELDVALRKHNVVEVAGDMLLLPPAELGALLVLVLALVTVHAGDSGSGSPVAVPARAVTEALAEDHDVPSDLARGVMGLFGGVDGDGCWSADVEGMVREVGRGLLVQLKKPRPFDDFMRHWHTDAGDAWASHAALDRLTGEYLLCDPPPSAFAAPCQLVQHFPLHGLPSHAATRFTDLFLTRNRWRPDDMEPFLRGLFPEGDKKARDKLVAKFVRVVKEKDGSWWYPRRTGA